MKHLLEEHDIFNLNKEEKLLRLLNIFSLPCSIQIDSRVLKYTKNLEYLMVLLTGLERYQHIFPFTTFIWWSRYKSPRSSEYAALELSDQKNSQTFVIRTTNCKTH